MATVPTGTSGVEVREYRTMQTERGHEFEAIFNGPGVEIRRIKGESLAWMQGDDSETLRVDLERIEDKQFPQPAFPDAESLIDAILSQYV